MSGIYIKGMEMPWVEHQEIDIRHGADGKWYAIDDGEWYEIIPVPDHGRLCDLDELIKAFKGIAKQNMNMASFPKSWGHAYYEVAEVTDEITDIIIPADKEK